MDKYDVVKKHIDKMDYYNLLSFGAPNDEFDGEAKRIAGKIEAKMSAAEISEIIAEVFNKSFDKREKPENYLSVAEAIAYELDGIS